MLLGTRFEDNPPQRNVPLGKQYTALILCSKNTKATTKSQGLNLSRSENWEYHYFVKENNINSRWVHLRAGSTTTA